MRESTGFDRETGALLTGFDHVRQSIGVVLTTLVGSLVMRRGWGSEVMGLIDRPMSDKVVLALYAACASALAKHEPRFRLTGCRIVRAAGDGLISLELTGDYLPRGHVGDPTPANDNLTVSTPLLTSAA